LKLNGSLYFDVGSQDSGVMIVSTPTGELQKLTYAKNSSGIFARTGLTTLLSGLPRATALDLSPDGNRIAYRGGDGTHLMVYSISDGSIVEWSSGPWAWDFAWTHGGASIALLEQTNPVDGRSHLYELTGPGQRTEILNMRYMDRVEVSRTDSTLLLLSYNSEDGQQTFVGTWRMPSGATAGTWVAPSLAGRSVSNRGVFSCDDKYLIYGSSGHAGAQEWYARALPAGADLIINKVPSNAEPQSWSSCVAATTATGDAFQFRQPSH
jgi:WD40 repeat protein